jgi:hypothetical protein
MQSHGQRGGGIRCSCRQAAEAATGGNMRAKHTARQATPNLGKRLCHAPVHVHNACIFSEGQVDHGIELLQQERKQVAAGAQASG